jgi:pentafunctional AROM polypeptide
MGDALARKLGRKFLDMDLVFQDVHKVSIKEYVEANNWKAFREIEEKLLKDTLLAHTTDHVISTGGGVVETPGAAEFLQQCGLIVIHLRRSILDVKALLEADNNRANLGEPVESIWERRRPIYEKLSQYEFSLLAGESQWATAEAELEVFARRVLSGGVGTSSATIANRMFKSH